MFVRRRGVHTIFVAKVSAFLRGHLGSGKDQDAPVRVWPKYCPIAKMTKFGNMFQIGWHSRGAWGSSDMVCLR